jgi:hypothetical protein
MGYQFLHVDTYARKSGGKARSAASIVAEAEREDLEHCPHVEQPKPPTLLHGVMPSAMLAEANAAAEQARDGAGRKLRSDAPILAAGVISLPAERADEWPEFRDASVAWLKQKYGDRLRSVIEHTDEEHPHLHFYAVPKLGETAESVHDGYAARQNARRSGEKAGAVLQAYQKAMRGVQDTFHEAVAGRFGLARLGPKRQRLDRKSWASQKAQLQAIASMRQHYNDKINTGIAAGVQAARKAAEKAGYAAGMAAAKGVGAKLGGAAQAVRAAFGGKTARERELEGALAGVRGELEEARGDVTAAEHRVWQAEQREAGHKTEAVKVQEAMQRMEHRVKNVEDERDLARHELNIQRRHAQGLQNELDGKKQPQNGRRLGR